MLAAYKVSPVHPGAQLQVDAREFAAAAEQVLRCAQVHHRQGAAAGGHTAGHAHCQQVQAALQLHRACAKRALRRGIEEHRGRCKKSKAIFRICRPRE